MSDFFASLLAVLETTPARWFDLTQAFPNAALRQRPAPNEWSALECLLHVWELEDLFATRVRAFLAGQDFPAFSPDDNGARLAPDAVPQRLAADFAARRQANLALVRSLSVADLERRAIHGELGAVSLGHMLHEWGGHDLMHLVQAEQALMQPFIAGCGAWQVYFTPHVARQR